MPTIAAMGIAFIASFVAGGLVPDSFGLVAQLVVSTAAWYIAFYKARAWLRELRNG